MNASTRKIARKDFKYYYFESMIASKENAFLVAHAAVLGEELTFHVHEILDPYSPSRVMVYDSIDEAIVAFNAID